MNRQGLQIKYYIVAARVVTNPKFIKTTCAVYDSQYQQNAGI